MKNKELILSELQKVPENKLILIKQFYRNNFMSVMNEQAFMQAISRLCKTGTIERVSKGIYCRPKATRFGTVTPSDKDIIDYFTADHKGVTVGYTLFNLMGITTQIPKKHIVYSAVSEQQLKQINNVTIYKYDLKYTKETNSIIYLMELLHNYREIEDLNMPSFIKCAESLSEEYSDDTFETVQKELQYPKWTIAFLRGFLDYKKIHNTLEKHLSSLSSYNIPNIEELYESAQKYV